jgi:hypothetical protein
MNKIRVDEPLNEAEFHRRLRAWHLRNVGTRSTIGDLDQSGVTRRTPWVYVVHNSQKFRLNADTRWDGVTEYLNFVDNEKAIAWHRNLDGGTAVRHGSAKLPISKFHLYFCSSRSR